MPFGGQMRPNHEQNLNLSGFSLEFTRKPLIFFAVNGKLSLEHIKVVFRQQVERGEVSHDGFAASGKGSIPARDGRLQAAGGEVHHRMCRVKRFLGCSGK
jgi:hypothetical protein